SLRYRGQNDATFINNLSEERRKQSRIDFEQATENFNRLYEQIDFNLSFFEQINFFTSNVVAIGANGSGKTTLSKKFKSYLQTNGVVISAQRILLVPDFDSIANPSSTADQLKQAQTRD